MVIASVCWNQTGTEKYLVMGWSGAPLYDVCPICEALVQSQYQKGEKPDHGVDHIWVSEYCYSVISPSCIDICGFHCLR